jgi:hypothetical protein
LNTTSLDEQGSLSVGLSEHLAFPEIHPDQTDVIFGVQSTFVSTAKNKQQAEQLFRALGFPFKSQEQMEETELQLETASSRAAKAKQKTAEKKPKVA